MCKGKSIWTLVPWFLLGCVSPEFSGQDAGDSGGTGNDSLSSSQATSSGDGKSTPSDVSSSSEEGEDMSTSLGRDNENGSDTDVVTKPREGSENPTDSDSSESSSDEVPTSVPSGSLDSETEDISSTLTSEQGSDTGQGSDSGQGSDTGQGSGSEQGSDTEQGTDTGQGSDIEQSTDTEQGTDTGQGSDTEQGTDTEQGSDTEVVSGTDTGIVTTVCDPNESRGCLNALGNCADGLETCLEDGSGWGACSVQPAVEDGCTAGDDANCNGTANEGCECDNGLEVDCGPENEAGICQYGVSRCVDGNWTTCEGAVLPGDRDCSSMDDNDCNGTPDNMEDTCLCDPNGAPRECDPYESEGRGVCSLGTQACVDNGDGTSAWSTDCVGADEPGTEVCDQARFDEDCDGHANEGCACTNGTTTPCGSDEGECVAGEQVCVNGEWSDDCIGETEAAARNCLSNQDNNCNGTIDSQETDFCKCQPDDEPLSCDPYGTQGRGVCSLGTRSCVVSSDGTSSAWSTDCVGADEPGIEVCDQAGLNEDCDGEINEGCLCTNGSRIPCGTDEGECVSGEQVCVDGAWSPECEGETEAAARNCLSDLDNDCNGTLDYLETAYCQCQPTDPLLSCDPYDTQGRGICTLGTRSCVVSSDGTSSNWSTDCVGAVAPQASEVCNSAGLDENCNGEIDEGCTGKPCANNNDCQDGLSCVANGGAKLGTSGSVCMPSHCNNNVQDSTETSVDCGGECGCRATVEWFSGIGGIEAISDNGEYIVGYKRASSSSSAYATYWDSSLRQWELDNDLDSGSTYAYGVNANGNVFVGSAYDKGPVRWLNRSMTGTALDSSVFDSGTAYAASASGSIVVGSANDGVGNVAFIWNNGTTLWEYDFYSFEQISSDGTVVLGMKTSSGPPALWTSSSGTIEIPLSGDFSHQSRHMSRDGNYVTGAVYSDSTGNVGYLWNRSGGVTMYDGDNNTPYPAAVANTGRIIGQSGRGGMPATYWDASTNYAPRLILDLITDLGYELSVDYELREPQVMTPDGNVIVGFGLTPGDDHMYKITLSE